jgi:hypothetical protein
MLKETTSLFIKEFKKEKILLALEIVLILPWGFFL